MSIADIIALISKTNKISLGFFVITCILLAYEFYLYVKDKKKTKKPSIPQFNKGKEPLSTHPAKPLPTPPANPLSQVGHSKQAAGAGLPPLISQMSPPTMNHAPLGAKKKKKLSRGAKVTVGATLALTVLTVGIAWRLNQPTQQQAVNTTLTRADESITPGTQLPTESTSSAETSQSASSSSTVSRDLIPTITPRPDIIDLTSVSPTLMPTVGQPSPTISRSMSETTTETVEDGTETESSEIAQLPVSGGSESATLAPTLPIAGTIQYSLGLLVIASAIVIASLIF